MNSIIEYNRQRYLCLLFSLFLVHPRVYVANNDEYKKMAVQAIIMTASAVIVGVMVQSHAHVSQGHATPEDIDKVKYELALDESKKETTRIILENTKLQNEEREKNRSIDQKNAEARLIDASTTSFKIRAEIRAQEQKEAHHLVTLSTHMLSECEKQYGKGAPECTQNRQLVEASKNQLIRILK